MATTMKCGLRVRTEARPVYQQLQLQQYSFPRNSEINPFRYHFEKEADISRQIALAKDAVNLNLFFGVSTVDSIKRLQLAISRIPTSGFNRRYVLFNPNTGSIITAVGGICWVKKVDLPESMKNRGLAEVNDVVEETRDNPPFYVTDAGSKVEEYSFERDNFVPSNKQYDLRDYYLVGDQLFGLLGDKLTVNGVYYQRNIQVMPQIRSLWH